MPDALAAGLVALAVFVWFGHSFLNYDTFYALVWGGDLASGRTPQYDVPVAPTPHPLATAVGLALSPLGDAAEDVILGVVLVALGAVCVGMFRLGQALYAWPVGLLAAAIVVTRVPFLNFGIRGYVDLPTVALIVWAAVLEARRPRRGGPVLVLLSLAGLLRPEAWLFAAAYWVWLARPPRGRGEQLRLAAIAAVAPAVWVLSDLLVTGDPLWSFHGTAELAADLDRRTGLDAVPGVLPFRLGEIVRLPELIAAVLGFVAGVVWLRERTLLPAAVAVLNGAAFVVFALARLPLLTRYLLLAASMLALFAAVAVFGWRALGADHPARSRWRAGGVAVLAALLLFAPVQLDRLDALRDDIAKRDLIQADLRDLVREPAVQAELARCDPLYVPGHRPIPLVAYWSGKRPRDIRSYGTAPPGPEGLTLIAATAEVARLAILDPREPGAPHPEVSRIDGRLVAENRSWFITTTCS